MNTLERELKARLLGYGRWKGSVTFSREAPERRQIVFVDHRQEERKFYAQLSDIKSVSDQRHRFLGEFRDSDGYSYSDRPLDDAIAECLADFDTHALRWLEGKDVSSPAIEAREDRARNALRRDLSLEARAAFRANDFTRCLELFDRAGEIAPLDGLEAKMARVARKKQTEG